MVRSRTLVAIAGILGSLAVSVLLWYLFDSFVFFLFVPFVPFLLGRRRGNREESAVRRCPSCGFETDDESFEYCPRDGRRLEVRP